MKKNILFVDDDPLMLNLYVVMMEGEADRWEITTVGKAADALKILDEANYDVVVSDMRMPGMDGVELMTEIRQRHPQTSRIMISGLGDQEQIARSLESTHQFLTKPVKTEELVGTLSRVRQLDAYLQDEKLRALVGKLDSLPSFPSTYLQIVEELNADEPSIETIADIAVKDPALTAKMLQVANAAAFGLAQKVSSPFGAVQFLGLTAVRSITLATHVFASFERTSFKGFSARQLWDDALRCSQITRLIMLAEKIDEDETEDACTAAMLRNAGKLMLAKSLPQPFQKAGALAAEQNLPSWVAEQEIFGANHSGVGAYLFGLWGLSAPMVEAVAFHLQPAKSETRTFSPLAAVHVANVFADEFSPDKITGKPAELDRDYLTRIGVNDRLDHWHTEVEKLFTKKA